MSAKNFVNQFKNTRRLAGLQGRRPPVGAQARPGFGKNAKNSDGSKKKPDGSRRPRGKFPGGKTK
jgi:hypothetical protein